MARIPQRKKLPWESSNRTGFQEANRKTDPRYHTRQWRKVRAYVLATEPLCRLCIQAGKVSEPTDVDHIVPVRLNDDGFFVLSNLQPLCTSCHRSKSAKEKGVTNG
jgi:5-methylcytosine-specific restriction protein A